MRIYQLGNFGPLHSTENELHDALWRLPGVQTLPIQENDEDGWRGLITEISIGNADMVLWTSTRGLNKQIPEIVQREMLMTAYEHEVPTVGYHLDRWWGLHANKRQEQMFGPDGGLLPFFGVSTLFTADGGHQKEWADVGVNHIWMPPGVSERWCYLAQPDPRHAHDIVFVGAWENYGHTEWAHRHEMIAKVRGWYGDRFRCYPKSGQPRITMGTLNTIYASAKVVIGDSCLVPNDDGSPCVNYCSDRIPETLGHGGILVHPIVDGINIQRSDPFSWSGASAWPLGKWDELHRLLDEIIGYPSDLAEAHRRLNIRSIKRAHTYTHRMREVLELTTGYSP